MSSTKKFNVYQMVTERVISMLEQGHIPWEKAWTGSNGAWSRATGKNYSILNQILLGEAGEYATAKQIMDEGGTVKGLKARQVVFFKRVDVEVDGENGEKVVKQIPFLRYSNVFRVQDCGLEPKYNKVEGESIIDTDEYLEGVKFDYISNRSNNLTFVENNGEQACYNPLMHKVEVPKKECFSKQAEYYSTLFHELAHSTGHSTLLDRGLGSLENFGSDNYSREELVAELTSASILANAGVETESSFRNTTAYIESWISALKNDNRMLVWASSRADKAYNLIMGVEAE